MKNLRLVLVSTILEEAIGRVAQDVAAYFSYRP